MTDIAPNGITTRPRIELIDIVRAIALLAMASYHFTWDLDTSGYVRQGLANSGPWKAYARCIASGFLFLVGIGLFLAHGRGIRWRSFWIREAQIVAGALAVTVATLFLTPGGFIFFGILHQIALASLIGLLFLRLPTLLTFAAAIATIALPFLIQMSLTEPRWLAWIGLATRAPVSNDYVPIFPWTGIVLLGIAAARLLDGADGWKHMARLNEPLRRLAPLAALGRHSLIFYLVHQPVLFGLVAGAAYLFPPDRTVAFTDECLTECKADDATCRQACACVGDKLKAERMLASLMERRLSESQTERLSDMVQECRLPLRTP